jgi:hypothetical protein
MRKIGSRVHFRTLFVVLGLGFLCVLGGISPLRAQGGGAFTARPRIRRSPIRPRAEQRRRRLEQEAQDGTIRLTFEAAADTSGRPSATFRSIRRCSSLRRTVCRAIDQRSNPRALFFNDRAMLGWVRDGTVIEVTTHDEREGIVFYTLAQTDDVRDGVPQFKRSFQCLGCHVTGDTLGVAGLLMFSTTRPSDPAASGLPS